MSKSFIVAAAATIVVLASVYWAAAGVYPVEYEGSSYG